MSRTVAALYDSRAEAEVARSRLVSATRAKAPRIIGRDTAGAIDGLHIDRKDKDIYRDALRQGAHLVVAEVPGGINAKRVVELLQEAATDTAEEREVDTSAESRFGFEIGQSRNPPAEPVRQPAAAAVPPPRVEEPQVQRAVTPPPAATERVVEEERVPVVEEELRVGKREVARGGARVRSFTREAQAEEQVSLNDEIVEVDSRPSGRRLSDSELEGGGLFKERVFEIAEMREEPVVTKIAVVREEVIVRKTVKERTETIRDTVRHTEVQVEDLPAAEETRPRFFTRGPTRPGS